MSSDLALALVFVSTTVAAIAVVTFPRWYVQPIRIDEAWQLLDDIDSESVPAASRATILRSSSSAPWCTRLLSRHGRSACTRSCT